MRAPWKRIIGGLALALTLGLSGCNSGRAGLEKDLKSVRPEIRAGAVHRLSQLADPQDLGAFILATRDHAPVVRVEAATALGTLTDPHAMDALSGLLADPDEAVQASAAQALARFPGDKAHAYLVNAFARRGTATRAAIARAFGGSPALQEAVRKEADGIWERNSKALDTGGAAEKVGAAEELGRSGRPEAVARLIPLLGNDAILLAAGAAHGLGSAGDAKAVAPLVSVLKENYPSLREAAAQALGDLGDGQVASVLAGVATGSDPSGLEACASLTRLPDSKEAKAALCQVAATAGNPSGAALVAKEAQARGGCALGPTLSRLAKGGAEARAALAALARLDAGKPEVVARIAPFLAGDRELHLRLAAVRALGAVGTPEAGEPLAALVKSETARLDLAREKWIKGPLPRTYAPGFGGVPAGAAEAPRFQEKMGSLLSKVHQNNVVKAEAAGQTLHQANDPAPREIIADTSPEDFDVLAAAASALGQTKSPEAQALLEPLAADANPEVQTGALIGLAHLGGAANLARIQAAWAQVPAESVPALSEALAGLGGSAVPVLIAGLGARSEDRAAMALALGALKAKPAVGALIKLLDSGGEEAVSGARALGQIGDPQAVKPLAMLLVDPRAAGHVEAIEALGLIKDPASRPALERQLFSDRPETRAAAVRALVALGVATSSHDLEALRGDYYREVRSAVEQALGGVPQAASR